MTQHGEQVRLRLDRDVSALAIPITLCAEATQFLTARRCVPPVLGHPYTPEHHILLTGQRYGVLPWPDDVHQVVGALLLPPSVTPRGPISWMRSPRQESLQLCRELDAFAAFRTIPNTLTGGSRDRVLDPQRRTPYPDNAHATPTWRLVLAHLLEIGEA